MNIRSYFRRSKPPAPRAPGADDFGQDLDDVAIDLETIGGEINGTYLDIASSPAPEKKTRNKAPERPPRERSPERQPERQLHDAGGTITLLGDDEFSLFSTDDYLSPSALAEWKKSRPDDPRFSDMPRPRRKPGEDFVMAPTIPDRP